VRFTKLSVSQQRGLICGAVMIAKEFGEKNVLRLDVAGLKPSAAQEILSKSYDITDTNSAVAVLEHLVNADGHNPAISEVFEHIIAQNKYEIARSIFAPIRQENLVDLDIPTNFQHFWKSVTNNANANLDAFMDYLLNPETSEQNATFHNITISAVVGRLNKHIKGYEQTLRSLGVFGYDAEELTSISTFVAWDLGRCSYLVRLASHCGYIAEDVALQYLENVGVAVYKVYVDWRQFLGALLLGRGMVQTADDMVDYNQALSHLLRDKKSPFKLYPLKNA